MHSTSRFRPVLLSAAIAAAMLAAPSVPAQTADDTTIEQQATVPRDRLVERYAELAGSDAAAADLVDALRSGGDFTVTTEVTTTTTNPDGTTTTTTTPQTTTVANPAGPMGWGEVNLSLSIAKALVDGGEAADLQSALAGTSTTVTNADGTTSTTTTGGVLAMRADGMGWGQIAKELGFKLGALVSAGNRNAAAGQDKAARAERTTGKPERVAKAERPARPDRPDRPAKPERPERPERPAKPERPGR